MSTNMSTSKNLKRVVITGTGIVSCIGNDNASVTKSLREGISGISAMPEFAELGMRSRVAGVPQINLEERIDRKQLRFMGDAAAYAHVALADAIALEDDLVMAQTRQAWAETVIETGEDFVVFDRAKTASLHPALRRRLMREGLTRLRSELRDMDYQVIEKGSHFFTDPCQSNTVHLIAGLEMFVHLKRRVVLAKKEYLMIYLFFSGL